MKEKIFSLKVACDFGAQHVVKIYPQYFKLVQSGAKSFEYRRDDRNYKVGDVLMLAEFDPAQKEFTGRVINSKITYILRGAFGLPNGYCVLSLGKIW